MPRFEFVVDGPPVSQQARRRDRVRTWRESVRDEAQRAWPSDMMIWTGALSVSITYFYADTALDADNIAKPILDALKGLIYVDDEQVIDVLVRKRDRTKLASVPSEPSILAESFARRYVFLHIIVEDADAFEVPR